MKIIEITVSPQGETCLETKGFAGASCQDASRFIENVLGRKTARRQTAEFHDVGTDQTLNTQRRYGTN